MSERMTDEALAEMRKRDDYAAFVSLWDELDRARSEEERLLEVARRLAKALVAEVAGREGHIGSCKGPECTSKCRELAALIVAGGDSL